jgi:acyl phosphate:glycerol-3-phosphate acyltransferase
MNGLSLTILTILIAYLVGAIPFGYLIALARGVDITALGSGNIGATNVGRVLGKRFGILVFILDFAKGAVPTGIGCYLAGSAEDVLPVAAGLAAVIGHMFPIYLRFKGGKGVATGAGTVFVLLPVPASVAMLAWLCTLIAFRYVSLASLVAAVVLCIVRVFSASGPFDPGHIVLTAFCFLAGGLVVIRHRGNIARLRHGTENRIRDSSTMHTFTKIVHVMSLGLWFGTVIFFSFVVGLSLLATFEQLTANPQRPDWLPLPAGFDKPAPSPRFPTPLAKEQGSRLFGAAVSPLFVWYFGIQTVCAVLALATALPLSRAQPTRVNRIRTAVLALALLSLGVDWWLDWEVHSRRDARSKTSDAVLETLRDSSTVPETLVQAADSARADFGRWHGYSLLANFATILLVTVAMAMAAMLPSVVQSPPAVEGSGMELAEKTGQSAGTTSP